MRRSFGEIRERRAQSSGYLNESEKEEKRVERERTGKDLYYVDGSVVRRRYSAEPARRRVPEQTPARRKKERMITYPRAAVQAEKSLYFDRGYLVVLMMAVMIMIASLGVMVYLQGKVDDRERNIRSLQYNLQEIKTDNAAYADSLESKYSLDKIYEVATKDLGMVYSQKGQIVYYEKANEDYVKQLRDVPEAK